jgi:predicted RNA-binding Zn-ribbon protein involved in translation (DUF1610 family)
MDKKDYDGWLKKMEGKKFLCPSCEEKVSLDYDTLMEMVDKKKDGTFDLRGNKTLKFMCPACEEVEIQVASHRLL